MTSGNSEKRPAFEEARRWLESAAEDHARLSGALDRGYVAAMIGDGYARLAQVEARPSFDPAAAAFFRRAAQAAEEATGIETADIEAAADAILAAGWRPPLPEPVAEPFDPDDESPAALTAAYLAHFLGQRPARMAAHIARGLDVLGLLAGAERQWGWRLAGHPDAVPVPASEATARKQAELDPDTEAVRRPVGEWEVIERG